MEPIGPHDGIFTSTINSSGYSYVQTPDEKHPPWVHSLLKLWENGTEASQHEKIRTDLLDPSHHQYRKDSAYNHQLITGHPETHVKAKPAIKKSFLLRSNDRLTPSTTVPENCLIRLADDLLGRYIIKHFSTVNHIYNVTSRNNLIYARTGGTDYTATITVGYYSTATLLASAAQTALTALGLGAWSVTTNAYNNKLIFAAPAAAAFVLQWGTFTTNSARKIMGYVADTDTASATSQTSDVPVNLLEPYSFSIHVDGGMNHYLNPSSAVNGLWDAAIDIPRNASFGSLLTYQATTDSLVHSLSFPQAIRELHVVLYDAHWNLQLENNQTDWNMVLEEV